ncbi:MAG: BamA/TamA family outer membrane protein [Kofleriaceae bacterium]
MRFITALCLVGAVASARADTIQEIIVEDNEKTTSDTVELIAKVEVGDNWSPEMVDLIKTRLVTSGLFKDVEVFYEPVAGGVKLHMLVRDKHSWVVAPAFYTQPTNVGGGVGFGENNLAGLNQKLLIYAQIATGDSYFVGAWVIPSIAGTRFYTQLDTYDKHSRSIEYANPTKYLDNPVAVRRSYIDYYNAGIRLGYDFYKGIIKLDTRLRAAYVTYSHVELDTQDNPNVTPADAGAADAAHVPAPGAEGWDISHEITFTVDRRANWYGIASGGKYTLTFEHSVLNSDFHYYEFNASAYKAWPILESHNLVLKGRIDAGHHMPFQQEFLTGGTSMRGWLNNQFRGDFRALANAEYSVPLFEIYGLQFRGIGFWDSAYTTFLTDDNPERNYLPNSKVRGLAGFKNSVGVGTRLFLRQIVLPLLGLDFGYGLEARDLQIYLAIGLTD